MLLHTTLYAATCNPDDVMAHIKKLQEVYFFTDVQVRGEYQRFQLKFMEQNNLDIKISEENKKILKGCG